MEVFDTLATLMAIPGPTGQEQAVLAWLEERWAGRVERVWTTKVGNLLAHVGGTGPRLLIQGHADEIGFVVRSIDDDGFLWLASGQAGRLQPRLRYPVGQGAPVPGVCATVTGHSVTMEQQAPAWLTDDTLFVDIGATSRAEAIARGIHPGAGVIGNPPPQRLGTRIMGKAIDDRVALAVMTLLLEDLDPAALAYDVYFAATVQGEIGLVGASSLRHDLDADLALALDNGLVGDVPAVGARRMATALRAGPTLVHKDHYVHYSVDLIWRLAAVAEREQIPIQHAVYDGFGSDGAALIRQGIPAALIAPATRYTHSAFEMIDERDVVATIQLLRAFITTPPGASASQRVRASMAPTRRASKGACLRPATPRAARRHRPCRSWLVVSPTVHRRPGVNQGNPWFRDNPE